MSSVYIQHKIHAYLLMLVNRPQVFQQCVNSSYSSYFHWQGNENGLYLYLVNQFHIVQQLFYNIISCQLKLIKITFWHKEICLLKSESAVRFEGGASKYCGAFIHLSSQSVQEELIPMILAMAHVCHVQTIVRPLRLDSLSVHAFQGIPDFQEMDLVQLVYVRILKK